MVWTKEKNRKGVAGDICICNGGDEWVHFSIGKRM